MVLGELEEKAHCTTEYPVSEERSMSPNHCTSQFSKSIPVCDCVRTAQEAMPEAELERAGTERERSLLARSALVRGLLRLLLPAAALLRSVSFAARLRAAAREAHVRIQAFLQHRSHDLSNKNLVIDLRNTYTCCYIQVNGIISVGFQQSTVRKSQFDPINDLDTYILQE